MARATLAWLALTVCVAACGPQQGVGANGDYVFAPNAPVVDSAPYPLRDLLQLEQDDGLHVALLYLFSGELGAAGIGLPDLRRLARGFGGFQMAFDLPRASYLASPPEDSPALTVALADGSTSQLHRLDDQSVRATGASRWLSSTDSDDYRVDAYFAAIDYDPELPALRVELAPSALALTPQLPAAALQVERTDEGLVLEPNGASADYLIVELLQPLRSRQTPDQTIEALVRTQMLPGSRYVAGGALLTSAASQGCWSLERSLTLRLTQVRRDYAPAPGGDQAVIQQRASSLELDPATWAPLVGAFEPASYCDRYEPAPPEAR